MIGSTLKISSLIALALLAAGCGTSVAKVSSPPATAASSTSSPTSSSSGPVGTVFQVTDSSGDKMTVKLTKVIDPAQGADQFTTPDNGKRFVGAVFTLRGVSGTVSDDANNDATLIGSNGQSYQADFDAIAGVTNFSSGQFNLSPGTRSVGAVVFQVPDHVKVAQIQWSATGGFGGTPAMWNISGS